MPLNSSRGLGERYKLPQRVRASPATKCILVHSEVKNEAFQGAHFLVFLTVKFKYAKISKIWNIQIQGLSRTFKDLLCFQGLSRAWNFFIQGLSRTSQGPYEPC